MQQRMLAVFEPEQQEYVYGVAWSPFRPAVFACATGSGRVLIYDLVESKNVPAHTLYAEEHFRGRRVRATRVRFHPRQRDFISASYSNGQVHVYQLNYSLATMQKNELKLLSSLMESEESEQTKS